MLSINIIATFESLFMTWKDSKHTTSTEKLGCRCKYSIHLCPYFSEVCFLHGFFCAQVRWVGVQKETTDIYTTSQVTSCLLLYVILRLL